MTDFQFKSLDSLPISTIPITKKLTRKEIINRPSKGKIINNIPQTTTFDPSKFIKKPSDEIEVINIEDIKPLQTLNPIKNVIINNNDINTLDSYDMDIDDSSYSDDIKLRKNDLEEINKNNINIDDSSISSDNSSISTNISNETDFISKDDLKLNISKKRGRDKERPSNDLNKKLKYLYNEAEIEQKIQENIYSIVSNVPNFISNYVDACIKFNNKEGLTKQQYNRFLNYLQFYYCAYYALLDHDNIQQYSDGTSEYDNIKDYEWSNNKQLKNLNLTNGIEDAEKQLQQFIRYLFKQLENYLALIHIPEIWFLNQNLKNLRVSNYIQLRESCQYASINYIFDPWDSYEKYYLNKYILKNNQENKNIQDNLTINQMIEQYVNEYK